MQLVVKVGGWLGLILIEQWATGVYLAGLQAQSLGTAIFLIGSGTLVLVGLALGLSYVCRHDWLRPVHDWRALLFKGDLALGGLMIMSVMMMTIMHGLGQDATTNQQAIAGWLSLRDWRRVWLIGQLVMIVPLMEELLFRGLFCRWFFVHHQVWQALFSAILFATVHEIRLSVSWLLYFGAGLILVILYQRQQDLKLNWVVHSLYNLLSLL
ncbi:CAAX amino terminal protease family protein (plasmid) [Lactiplantibacillus plantarum]|nr:CPBP family intramembrane glutamic endopeptidase [Lactiplantibacillus plantarum]BEI51734.1 CAAX amino terminal protease family protein [Lactiplantibacillus plantarum]